MIVQQNFSLKNYNTFNLQAITDYFIEIQDSNVFEDFLASDLSKINNRLILGGGSNILFTKNFNGLILHSAIKSIELLEQNNNHIFVRAGSGIIWDDFVDYCVEQDWGGIENLSDIPGCIGAAPVQNIGAYGVEAKDCVSRVEGYNLNSGSKVSFTNSDCKFGYRQSIFKQAEYKSVFITHVTFKLNKTHKLITKYGKVEEELSKHPNQNIKTLRKVITSIRQSKLPSTDKLGSAGSFFKNPVVNKEQFAAIQKVHPEVPFYKTGEQLFKIPAAWLIEKSGMKGYRKGDVGTYKNQPLVIVNYNNANGNEIAALSKLIQSKVADLFEIKLEPEVCFV